MQESKSMGITHHDAEGKFCIQIADHAAAMKAAQDAIAVGKRALLNANAALREDAERMRVMREALLDADHLCKWLLQSDISEADRNRVVRESGIKFAALASTAPDTRKGYSLWLSREEWGGILDGLILEIARTKGRVEVNPASTGEDRKAMCERLVKQISGAAKFSTAPVAEAGQKEGE